MNPAGLCVWGDSIAKGIVFDETRGRYAVCRENCLSRLARNFGISISNYSVMGQTSEDGLKRMHAQEMKEGQVAVLEYGGNDCDLDWKMVSENPSYRQPGKVPLEQFEKNMAEMVDFVRESGMKPLLVTPPPLVAGRYYEWVSKDLNRENILGYLGDVEAIYYWQKDYADAVRNIAAEKEVALLDIRSKILAQDHYEDFVCIDGIHPNEKGHAVIYDAAAALI